MVQRAVARMYKMFLDAPWKPWGITADHAASQVRMNGREALTTLIDLVQEGEEYIENVVEHERRTTECRLLVQKVLDALAEYFTICPACKGAKGAYDKERARSFGRGRCWEDCETCWGHGMLPKGESVWQDEGRTYTPAERQLDVRIDGIAERREAA